MSALAGVPQIRPRRRFDTTWQDNAACIGHDAELWFASSTEEAQQICGVCPAQIACAQYAADIGVTDGVWGGIERHLPAVSQKKPAPRHGTEARARWDQRRGITPCGACRDAAQRANLARKHMNRPAAEKMCGACGITKPGGEFYPKVGTRDGLAPYCKPCKRRHDQDWYRKNGRAARGRA